MKPPKKCKECSSPKIVLTFWKADKRVEQREGYEVACKFCEAAYTVPEGLVIVKKRELPKNLSEFSEMCRIGYLNVSLGNHEKCRNPSCPCPCGHKQRNEPVIPAKKPPDTEFKFEKEGRGWTLYERPYKKHGAPAPWRKHFLIVAVSVQAAQSQWDTRKANDDIWVVSGRRPG